MKRKDWDREDRRVYYNKQYCIARAINGISINGREYVLHDDGSLMTFGSRKEAEAFIIKGRDTPIVEDK